MTDTIHVAMNDAKLVPINSAIEWFPAKCGTKSIIRRIRTGHRGVRLKAVRDGGRWFTCREWVQEFIEAVTSQHVPEVPSAAERHKAAAAAMATLERRYGKRGSKAKRTAVPVR